MFVLLSILIGKAKQAEAAKVVEKLAEMEDKIMDVIAFADAVPVDSESQIKALQPQVDALKTDCENYLDAAKLAKKKLQNFLDSN